MKKFVLVVLMIFSIFSISVSAQEEYLKGRILKLEDCLSPEEEVEELKEIMLYSVVIAEGPREGNTILVEFPIYREEAFNINVKEGDRVVLYYEVDDEGNEKYYIADIDKRMDILYLTGIFVLIVLLLAKFKGFKAMIALLLVILFIYKIFLPGIILGYSPILLSVIVALFASVVTIYLMTGFNRKGVVAIIGSFGGVIIAGALSYTFVNTMRLTGYVTTETLNYASMLGNIKVKEMISAGVILGSMGAVMDVAMSIASALNELKEKNRDIHRKELFYSGMRIGSDIIGTMINTLILAYIGSSLMTSIFIYMQKDQYPSIRILNFESIVVEILRALCGSIGILIAVPVTAYIAAKIYSKNKKLNFFFKIKWKNTLELC